MFDLSCTDRRLFDLPNTVVEEILNISNINPADIMLIGAVSRDILHSAHKHTFALRSTSDIDVALTLASWDAFDDLVSRLEPTGDTGIRYYIRSLPVDLMPFGDIENPTGSSPPSPRKESVAVFGFREVFEQATPLTLPCGATVSVPHPAGYTALKMKAWTDRAPSHETKDASDLSVPAFWYQKSAAIQDRLYESKQGRDVLLAYDLEADRAAIHLLGLDVREHLGTERAAELDDTWSCSPLELFARNFGQAEIPGWPVKSDTQRASFAEALTAGLHGLQGPLESR